jgi:hypothetical protein
VNAGLGEKRLRDVLVVATSPNARAFAATSGLGAWEYTLVNRPASAAIHLPLVAENGVTFYSAADTFEDNDTQEDARLLTTGSYYSYIWDAQDVDWFRIQVGSRGRLSVDLEDIPPGADYDIDLFTVAGLQLGFSDMPNQQKEKIVFFPNEGGVYYIKVAPYSGFSRTKAYRLKLDFTSALGSGEIYGVLRSGSQALPNTPVLIHYLNGYRSARYSTLTDAGGAYHFRGLPTLPTGHFYYISYPHYEAEGTRLAYFNCYPFTGYISGDTRKACDPNVTGLALLQPPAGATIDLPEKFTWTPRGINGDNYELRLQDVNGVLLFQTAPLGAVGEYTLPGLPGGLSYGNNYYWFVYLTAPDGYGVSYSTKRVTFTAGQAAGEAVEPAGPDELRPLPEPPQPLPPIQPEKTR